MPFPLVRTYVRSTITMVTHKYKTIESPTGIYGDYGRYIPVDDLLDATDKAREAATHRGRNNNMPTDPSSSEASSSNARQRSASRPPALDLPPGLPPHLTKVLLNTHLNCETDYSLLPAPVNHVLLNHLYALSIRDGVMALATTSRYEEKYVTTIWYKPVFS